MAAEHAASRPGGSDTSQRIRTLYSYVPWPHYLAITPPLGTGLSDEQTCDLMTTRDPATAVHLVLTGLANQQGLPNLAA